MKPKGSLLTFWQRHFLLKLWDACNIELNIDASSVGTEDVSVPNEHIVIFHHSELSVFTLQINVIIASIHDWLRTSSLEYNLTLLKHLQILILLWVFCIMLIDRLIPLLKIIILLLCGVAWLLNLGPVNFFLFKQSMHLQVKLKKLWVFHCSLAPKCF